MKKFYAFSPSYGLLKNTCNGKESSRKTYLPLSFLTALVLLITSASFAQTGPLVVEATQTSTCNGGSIGSVNLVTSGGVAPYTFDYLTHSFAGTSVDTSIFETSKGNFSVNGELQASSVSGINTSYDNSIITKKAYSDNGFLRCEGSFKFAADATAFFGLGAVVPKTSAALPISFVFNAGFLSYRISGVNFSFGAYEADKWYDFKIEKKGAAVKFYFKKSSDNVWALMGGGNYTGPLASFKVSAQYYDDALTTRGFNSKNWKCSFNPSTTGLGAGNYTFTAKDAAGANTTSTVDIIEATPFSVNVATTNPSAGNPNSGSVNINSTTDNVAYIAAEDFVGDFAGAYDASKYTILNGAFSVSGDLRGEQITDNSAWANSITTSKTFVDEGYVKYEGTYSFDENSRVCFGLTSSAKPIENFGDHLISFYYNNGKLNYYINGVPSEIGSYAANTWINYKIEKIGNEVSYYTQADGEQWKLVARATYYGLDNSFKAGAQYYGVTSSNGAFNSKDWKVFTTAHLTGLSAGNYNYQVVSAGGCSANISFNIVSALTFTSSTTNVSCYGNNNGGITINAIGLAPLQYSINNGISYSQSNLFTGLTAGFYQIKVKDATGSEISGQANISQPQAVVSNIATSGPLTICQGSSVTLTASAGATYLWSNGATSPNITLNASGNFSVKVSDANGCSSTSTAVTVKVNALPVASITGDIDIFLCSGVSLLAHPLGVGYKYIWSRGDTTQLMNLTTADADGTYSLTVKDNAGCTSVTPASYSFQKQFMVEPYTIIGFDKVSLGSGTTVAKGSVGVMGSNGSLSIGSNVSIISQGAIVKAKNISLSSSARVSKVIYSAASLTLPPMQLNLTDAKMYSDYVVSGTGKVLSANYRNLTVRSGSEVTLNGSIYGNIVIETGAQVKFGKTTVDIETLDVQNRDANCGPNVYTIVRFVENAVIRVGKKVLVDDRCRINEDEARIKFYLGDQSPDVEKFTVNGVNTKIAADLYLPVGSLSVNGGDVSPTTMVGQYIAEHVSSSGSKVVWKAWDCNAFVSPITAAGNSQATPAEATKMLGYNLSVNVLPNPSTTEFLLVVKSMVHDQVTIQIADASGKLVSNITNVLPGAGVHVGGNFIPGTYFARITQGSQSIITQLIKVR